MKGNIKVVNRKRTVELQDREREGGGKKEEINVVEEMAEVEIKREKWTRYFFPVVSMALLVSVLLNVACSYSILQGFTDRGATILLLFLAISMFATLSYVGQTFVFQVTAAEGLLRDMTGKSTNLNFNVKVGQLIGRLSRNLSFDMCGWYNLGYSSFLWHINTGLTYLVIILQVGSITVSSPRNATALA